MTKPIVRIHNLETDEVIDREMTDAEFEIWKADQEANLLAEAEAEAKAQVEAEAKAQAKAAAEGKLAALGLTIDDLRALGL